MRKCLFTILILSLILCAGMSANAVVKRKPVKPLPKKPPVATVQLAGDNGVFGRVYSIGKASPLYIRMKSIEYTTEQVAMGSMMFVPKSDEKLMVLHFTVQNPQKAELFVRGDYSFRFTAVDGQNANHDAKWGWGNEDDPLHPTFAMKMKVKQTSNVYACIVVPAQNGVPKLMVLPPGNSDGPVLRYALNPDPTAPVENKPIPLQAPIADPKDPTGYSALDTVPGVVGAAYPYTDYDITVQGFEYTTGALDAGPPPAGGRYLIVTLLVKGDSFGNPMFRFDSIRYTLESTDGEMLKYQNTLLATANRSAGKNLKPGEEYTVRAYFTVPKDVTPKTLTMKQGVSRTYEYAVP